MKIGVITPLNKDLRAGFEHMVELGFDNCQLVCWDLSLYTDEMAKEVVSLCEEFRIEITALWCGWSGPTAWNFHEGPDVLGIVPEKYRDVRVKELKRGSDFAKKIGVTDVVTHVGFLPESPTSPDYAPILASIKDLALYIKNNGQYFLFETGQETPVAIKRIIEDCDTGNLGVNLDPANLILYGKANPVDSLDVIGSYVRGVHAKDGFYPTCAKELGREVKVGDGKANFPVLVQRLKELGFDGALTIEREISGDQQIKDIIETKKYLEDLVK